MKKLIFILFLFGKAFGQCAAPANITISNKTTTSASVSYTAASGATLYSWNVYTSYPSHTFITQGTTTSTAFNFTGLSANTTYRFQIVTICGLSVSSSDSVMFTTPVSSIVYTPMSAAGYEFKYLKADSGLALPFRDTLRSRSIDRGGLMTYKSNDGAYVYNGSYWEKLSVGSGADSSIFQTKFRSDTNRINVYTTIDTIQKHPTSIDGSLIITQNGNDIDFSVNAEVAPQNFQNIWDRSINESPTIVGLHPTEGRGTYWMSGFEKYQYNAYNVSDDSSVVYYQDVIDASASASRNSIAASASNVTEMQHLPEAYNIGSIDVSTGAGQQYQITKNAISFSGTTDSLLAYVGIGTTNPSTNLDVNGDTRFRANGTPGTGKIATGTDGLGNWTWQINSAVSTLQLTDSLNKIRDSISAHNIRIGANTTALAKFSDGTWQPTITSVANLDAVSINVCSYIKTDSVVTISGRFTFDPTSGGQTLTRARFTLPPGISSNFSDEWDAAGTATLNINTSGVNYGGIKADVTNDQIEIFFYPSTTTSFNYFFIGQFVIK